MKCRYCRKRCAPEAVYCPACGGEKPVPRRQKSVWEVLWVLMTILVVFLLTRKEQPPAAVAKE